MLQVKPPRVAESAVSMECRLVHTYDVKNASGAVTATIVIGQVRLVTEAKERYFGVGPFISHRIQT